MSKIFKDFIKVSKIFAISGSLLYSSTPALAQSGANAVLNTIGVLNSTLQQAAPQQNQMQMNPKTIEAQQLLSNMVSEQNYTNASLKDMNNPTNSHYIFKNCKVPPDSKFKVENFCAIGIVPPQDMAVAAKVAHNYIEMYENFMKPANAPMGIGQQCITETLNRMQDEADGRLKEFDEQIEIFKQNIKKVEDLQKANVEKMNQVSQLLYKGTQGTPELADINFSNMIGKDCSDTFKVTGSSINQVGKSQGLMSISSTMDFIDESAMDFRGPSIKVKQKRIQEDIKILANEYRNGISNISTAKAKNKIRPENWSLLENAMKSKLLDVKADTAEVNNLINELNSTLGEQATGSNTIPSIEDPNYELKMNSMLGKLDNQYKNKFVLSCIRGQNSANRSDPVTSFLKDFKHQTTGNKGNITSAYSNGTIQGIVKNAKSINELEDSLSAYYNSKITTRVANQDGKTVYKSLKTLVNEQVEQCTRVYTGEDKTATTDDGLNNFKKILDKVKTKTNSIAKRTIGSSKDRINFQKELSDKVLNCDGKSIATQDCTDAKSLWSESSPSFCLKKANFCSQKVAQCGERIKNVKDQYTAELKNRETQYNNQVKLLEAQATSMVQKMKQKLTAEATKIHNEIYPKALSTQAINQINNNPYLTAEQKQFYLKGSNNDFNLPPLDPISLSEDKRVIPGASIKGGEDLRKELFSLTAGQMQNMKKQFQSYVQEKLSIAENVANDIKDNWQNEMDEWADIKEQCVGAIAQIEQNEAEMAQKQAEQQAEAKSGYSNFCNQLNGLAQQEQPVAACGDTIGKLLDENMKIASVYVPDAYGLGQEMKSICMGANNNSSDKEKSERDIDYVDQLCRKGGNWNSALAKVKKDLKKNIPERLKKYEKRIKDFIDGKRNDVPEKIEDDVFVHTIDNLKKMEEMKLGSPLTEQYFKNNLVSIIEKDEEVKKIEEELSDLRKEKRDCDIKDKTKTNCKAIDEAITSKETELAGKITTLEEKYETEFDDYISSEKTENVCKIDEQLNKRIFDKCRNSDSYNKSFSTISTCMKDSEIRQEISDKFKENNDDYQDINFALKNVMNAEKSSAWAEIGEKYKYTSCAHITGNSIQKGMLESLGQDMANPFNINGFMR